MPCVIRGFSRDARQALRVFRRQPVAFVMAALGLAVGIGVSTATFTLFSTSSLLSGMGGLRDPSSVFRVSLGYQNAETGAATHWKPYWPAEQFAVMRRATTATVEASVVGSAELTVEATAEPESVSVTFVTAGYFPTLGAQAARGRLLGPDDSASNQPAVVMSYAFWRNRFGGDERVLGRTIRLGQASAVVVGVASRAFRNDAGGNVTSAFWTPFASWPAVKGATRAVAPLGFVVARRRANVSADRMQAELVTLVGGLRDEQSDDKTVAVRLDRADRPWWGNGVTRVVVSEALTISAPIALVVVLACAGVANLLLANAMSRTREIGVRLALGATRWRMTRQFMTESLLLSLAGGSVGFLFAQGLVGVLQPSVAPSQTMDLSPDSSTFVFVVALSAAVGLATAFAPARYGARGDLLAPLRGTRAENSGSRRSWLRGGLLATQAAVSLVVIVLAAIFARALAHASSIDLGFDPARVMTVSVALGGSAGEDRYAAYWTDALDKLPAVTGVERAAFAAFPIPTPSGYRTAVKYSGRTYRVLLNETDAAYFDVLGTRLLRGRTYSRAEVTAGDRVAVVSEQMARDVFGGADPIGRRLAPESEDPVDVIGVVTDAMTARLSDPSRSALYVPLPKERELSRDYLILRTVGPASAAVRPTTALLRSLAAGAAVTATPAAFEFNQELDGARFVATLAGVVGIMALALAVIGIYSIAALMAGQRLHEVGVRLALGATATDVGRHLMAICLRPVALGVGIGLGASFLGTRVLAAAFFGVGARDPISFTAATIVLLGAALAAAAGPVRRAMRADPADILRDV